MKWLDRTTPGQHTPAHPAISIFLVARHGNQCPPAPLPLANPKRAHSHLVYVARIVSPPASPIEFMVEDTEAQPEVTKKELKSWWEGGGEGGGIQPFLCPLALRSPPLSLVSCVSFDLVSPPRFARPSRVPRVNTGAGERVMSPVGPARAGVFREGRWTDADCEW